MANQVKSRTDAKKALPKEKRRMNIASLSGMTSDSNFSKHILQYTSGIKNAKGDNSQVFFKKDSSCLTQKLRKKRKESLRKSDRFSREETSIKLVPLHINDVLDALKQAKKSSLSALVLDSNKYKIECLEADTLSAKRDEDYHHNELFDLEEKNHRRRKHRHSFMTEYLNDLSKKYMGRCESEMRRNRRSRRRKPIRSYGSKKWSQALIQENMKFSEKSFPLSKTRKIRTRMTSTTVEKKDFLNTHQEKPKKGSQNINTTASLSDKNKNLGSDNKSDGQSSLTFLTLIPQHQNDNTDSFDVERIKTQKKSEESSNQKGFGSLSRRKDKRHLNNYDEKGGVNSLSFSDSSYRRGRKVHGKSFNISAEKDIQSYESKNRGSLINPEKFKTMYISKSQENNTYKTHNLKHRKKRRARDHSRTEKQMRKERHQNVKPDGDGLNECELDSAIVTQKMSQLNLENDYIDVETRSSEKPRSDKVKKYRTKKPYRKYERVSWSKLTNASQNQASKKQSNDENSENNDKNDYSEKSYKYSEQAYSYDQSEKNFLNYSEKSYENAIADLTYHINYSDMNYQNNYSSELNYQANFSENLQCNTSENNFCRNSYQRMVMSNSETQNEFCKDAENASEIRNSGDIVKSISEKRESEMKPQAEKNETNLEPKASKPSHTSGAQENVLVEQKSNIILKTGLSQTQKMHITVSDTLYFLRGSKNYQEKSLEEQQTDSCLLDVRPSETCNIRYKKNRLNNNLGLLNRISVPDFYHGSVSSTNTKIFRRSGRKKSRIIQNVDNCEYFPSNDPLRNMLLTRLVRQNSTMSIIEERPRPVITISKSLHKNEIALKKSLPNSKVTFKNSLPEQTIASKGANPFATDMELYYQPLISPAPSTLPPSVQPAVSEPTSEATNLESNSEKKKSTKKVNISTLESDFGSSQATIVTRSGASRRGGKFRKLRISKSFKSKKSSTIQDSSDDNSLYNEKYYQRSGHTCHIRKKTRRINSSKSKSTLRSQPRSMRKDRVKNNQEKKLKNRLQLKSDSSQERSISCPLHYGMQESKRSTGNFLKEQNKKCAVENCHKRAVDDTEHSVPRTKQSDLHHPRWCHHSNSSDETDDKINYAYRGEHESGLAKNKNCISCTLPLMERNKVGSPPLNKTSNKQRFFEKENLALEETELDDQNLIYKPTLIEPYSREDFRQALSHMGPCISNIHHRKFPSAAKRYHSPMPANLYNENYASSPYNSSPSNWKPEIGTNASHSIQCRLKKQGCLYHSYDDSDNVDFFYAETSPLLEQHVDFPTVAPAGINFEPFPFMQLNSGPLTDPNGRPLLILDEDGNPILDYDGDPITPETYTQANEEYEFNSGFRIMCENSAIKTEKTQVEKFSTYIPGFISPTCQYEIN